MPADTPGGSTWNRPSFANVIGVSSGSVSWGYGVQRIRARLEVTIEELERNAPSGEPTLFQVRLVTLPSEENDSNLLHHGTGKQLKKSNSSSSKGGRFPFPKRGTGKDTKKGNLRPNYDTIERQTYEIEEYYFGKRTLVTEVELSPGRDLQFVAGYLSVDSPGAGTHFTISDARITIETCRDYTGTGACFRNPPSESGSPRINLVSGATCEDTSTPFVLGDLVDCSPNRTNLPLLHSPKSVVPRQTTLKLTKDGDCDSYSAYSLKVRLDEEPWEEWHLKYDDSIELRRRDRGRARNVFLSTGDSALSAAKFDPTCEIGVVLDESNAADIRSRRDAQDVIDVLSSWLDEAQSARDGWRAVVQYLPAFDLLESLSEHWHAQIVMSEQDLYDLANEVAAAYGSIYALAENGMLESSLGVQLTTSELLALLDLKIRLESAPLPLGGTYRDVLGGGSQQILQAVDQIAYAYERRNVQREYEEWELELQRAKDEMTVAQVLLEDWLTEW